MLIPMSLENQLLLTPSAVAKLLGIGRTKAYQLTAAGILPTIKIGRCVRVPAAALQEWIAANTSSPGSDHETRP